ncbi:hypothetical protein [Solimonas sp. SE-A11]|uniref:hypothetical protein n=1 Tax=Solimonas sp. SE-A11 TaxID=3054954 RepID=UPI00259CFACC|nr:hypothetical protein [Solimonas sp. SE-A11]MDM4771985.1 hypothetical protein [Solimonas sp. SE-A11]
MIRRQDVSVPCCKLLAAALLALSGLTACGSQMDSIDNPDTRPVSQAPAGIYEGRLSSTKTGVTQDVVAFLDSDKKRFLVFTEDGKLVAGGLYTATSPSLSWTAKVYRKVITTTKDPVTGADVTTTSTDVTTLQGQGGFEPEKSIQLTYTTSDNDFGSLTLAYSKLRYEQRSNLASLAGIWGIEDEFGLATTRYTISQDGQITGSDDKTKCTYQGSLTIIDLHYNLYRLSLSELCGNTTISTIGLATLNQAPNTTETIQGVAIASDSAVAFLLDPL